ncbi:MAG: histidine kinase, partial [Verrucomicrobia bacterium]|nr:histidine kinase [Verrucomicrobiota bacterium]
MGAPNDEITPQLAALADDQASRREQILAGWREAARADPRQTTIDSLSRVQFNDHIPSVLDAFERKLRSRPGTTRAAAAEGAISREETMHGLQRWQQGYSLLELMREWGHLHLCLLDEIDRFASRPPGLSREAQVVAHRELAELINEGITESANQYARMSKAEAQGLAADLERALATMKEIERRRTALIHETVHDLRGNVQTVASAAEVLRSAALNERDRVEFATLLQQGVVTVS